MLYWQIKQLIKHVYYNVYNNDILFLVFLFSLCYNENSFIFALRGQHHEQFRKNFLFPLAARKAHPVDHYFIIAYPCPPAGLHHCDYPILRAANGRLCAGNGQPLSGGNRRPSGAISPSKSWICR